MKRVVTSVAVAVIAIFATRAQAEVSAVASNSCSSTYCCGPVPTQVQISEAWLNYVVWVGYNAPLSLPPSFVPFESANCFGDVDTWLAVSPKAYGGGLLDLVNQFQPDLSQGFTGSLTSWVIASAIAAGSGLDENGNPIFSRTNARNSFNATVAKFIKTGQLTRTSAGYLRDGNVSTTTSVYVANLVQFGAIFEAGFDLAKIFASQRAGVFVGDAITQTEDLISLILPQAGFELFQAYVAQLK